MLVVQRSGQPLEQDAGEADDGVERGSQFMAHGGDEHGFEPVELLQLFIGRLKGLFCLCHLLKEALKLGCSLAHLLIEGFIEIAKLLLGPLEIGNIGDDGDAGVVAPVVDVMGPRHDGDERSIGLQVVPLARADTIAVVNHGRIIARGTADELKSQVGGERIEVVVHGRDVMPRAIEVLTQIADEQPIVDEHTRKLTVPAHGGAARLVQVVRDLDEAGIGIDDIALRRPTLDDVFLSLTGHASEATETAA